MASLSLLQVYRHWIEFSAATIITTSRAMLRNFRAPSFSKINSLGNGIRFYSLNFPEPDKPTSARPLLGQFKYPLLHVFLISSTVYMLLHALRYKLEYDEEKTKLAAKEKAIELEIQEIINRKQQELNNKWYKKLSFW